MAETSEYVAVARLTYHLDADGEAARSGDRRTYAGGTVVNPDNFDKDRFEVLCRRGSILKRGEFDKLPGGSSSLTSGQTADVQVDRSGKARGQGAKK